VKCSGKNCVLDVFVAAGYSLHEAAQTALEYTCFPMNCDLASAQARAFLADPDGYLQRWEESIAAANVAAMLEDNE
jgi:hypothetical protein